MFAVTVADYISRAESQSRQNLPQKENHAGPEPKVPKETNILTLCVSLSNINQIIGSFSLFPHPFLPTGERD